MVLDLLNLAEADSSPHTCVQMHKCAKMLNQPTSNDFHVVTFLTNTNTHLHTNVHTHTHTLRPVAHAQPLSVSRIYCLDCRVQSACSQWHLKRER